MSTKGEASPLSFLFFGGTSVQPPFELDARRYQAVPKVNLRHGPANS